MSAAELLTSKGLVITGTVILLGGVGVWAYTGYTAEPESTLPKDLQVEALKENVEDPGKMFEKMREARRREDLSEEQRRELRDNFRTVFEERMNQQMDQYFTVTPEEQVALLDEQIDQFQDRAADWERRREEWRKEREAREKERAESDQAGEGEGDRRQEWRNRMANMDRSERKERSETRNPDQMARRMAYFNALRNRAEQRGIQMPFGRGGRGGGGFGRGDRSRGGGSRGGGSRGSSRR